MLIRQALGQASQQLAAAGIETPDVDAAELHAIAEAEKSDAARLKTSAEAEAHAAAELSRENARQRDHLVRELQRLAKVTPEQARELLIDHLREEYGEEAQHLRRGLLDQVEQDIDDEARRKLLSAMQRLTTSTTQDATAITVSLPNEDMKGRLIGREGRNIRTFEQSTGATLLIDETPGLAMVSCFDPVRREIARIALERIVKDGRISPGLIEDSVRDAAAEVVKHARRLGRDAVRDLGGRADLATTAGDEREPRLPHVGVLACRCHRRRHKFA